MKVSIIGTGNVGATLAYTLLIDGSVTELVLVNRTLSRAIGEAADLEHAAAFLDASTDVRAGQIDETTNSDIVVLTLSVAAESPDRDQLAGKNALLFRETIPELARQSPHAVLLVISNPVEPLCFLAKELSGFEPHRVIGTGTLIDSARLRSELSKQLSIHEDDVRTYVIGEHGEMQFPVLSSAMTGGIRLKCDDIPKELVERAIRSSDQIFRQKGYTNFAIAQAAMMIIRSVLKNQLRTLPVSTLLDGYYGIHGVYLSIPCVLGKNGIARQLFLDLDETEISQLRQCAAKVRRVWEKINAQDASDSRNP